MVMVGKEEEEAGARRCWMCHRDYATQSTKKSRRSTRRHHLYISSYSPRALLIVGEAHTRFPTCPLLEEFPIPTLKPGREHSVSLHPTWHGARADVVYILINQAQTRRA